MGIKDTLYARLVEHSLSKSSVEDVMLDRVYFEPIIKNYLEENNLKYSRPLTVPLDLMDDLAKVGWVDKNNTSEFILNNRVVIPIRNAKGEIITLVGWRKGKSKYLTVPSSDFSKESCWFNIDRALSKSFSTGSVLPNACIVVEGIFDALMLDAIGLPAIATMGYDVNNFKGSVLDLFDKVICLPDNDKVGQRALRDKTWKVPSNATFVYLESRRVHLGDDIYVTLKDADNLVNYTGNPMGIVSVFQQLAQEPYASVHYL